jgi:hypothetical protein
MLPVVREGRKVHQREKKLFRNHYLKTKKKLQEGIAKVRAPQITKQEANEVKMLAIRLC